MSIHLSETRGPKPNTILNPRPTKRPNIPPCLPKINLVQTQIPTHRRGTHHDRTLTNTNIAPFSSETRVGFLSFRLGLVGWRANHAAKFIGDMGRREMFLDAEVNIEGSAKVVWWDHRFMVHVDSHATVDPVFLDPVFVDVIDQENKSQLELMIE